MAMNFKKNNVVGVSVSSELGLEVAQIDYESRTVLKYGRRPLDYDNNRKDISDLDIFKETLQELLFELGIQKGTELFLNIPTVRFAVTDYPASLDNNAISNAIEEALLEHPIFQNNEPDISAVVLPNSTIQFNKVAYTVAQKTTLTEIAMQIQDLGYVVGGIDTSVNSALNALIYNGRVDVSPDANWVMLLVDNGFCRVIPMQGRCYVDCFEERISIGEILGDEENYATVVHAVAPLLKNIPSQRLHVVSKTNIISAEVLASKLSYKGQIIHEEANAFAKAPYLETVPEIDRAEAITMSLDVIGAAINKAFEPYSAAHFNLFNASLGDVYILSQPPEISFGSLKFVMSMFNMIKLTIVVGLVLLAVIAVALVPLNTSINESNKRLSEIDSQIKTIQAFLDANKEVSTSTFDEGDEIRLGLTNNKRIYQYYTIVGTEIPKKLWLTSLSLGEHTTIEGQADNLESVYSFYRNVKDYDPDSAIKLQKLGLATKSNLTALADEESFDTDSIITSMNADFYEFRISDAPDTVVEEVKEGAKKAVKKAKSAGSKSPSALPDLE